jgi:hypothetical protein
VQVLLGSDCHHLGNSHGFSVGQKSRLPHERDSHYDVNLFILKFIDEKP